ncbi:hypothetical protein FD13_GL000261 [Levilactobacillus senmaizukei DSM 21775 = NBRC 103853]|uniref:Uncharacterized protein n=1 Tax=Levilactobacillus senmaizukei DSM 21775 = NBRC 103853 TaxID=1423803 RepID=A0A0R2DPH4_9LACO|nr:hypothetical protein [Levilactobacillus senmaizukei]KRN02122.1 hypothetical protein FD13_GL000261 [Levilactobacillus senmaizukei DSM 21775 = NBRC 103853]
MNEMVLFNPGDSIGNFHDYNEAVRTAQIYQERHTESGHVLVVKSEGGVPSFDIFIADQQLKDPKEPSTTRRYTISKEL